MITNELFKNKGRAVLSAGKYKVPVVIESMNTYSNQVTRFEGHFLDLNDVDRYCSRGGVEAAITAIDSLLKKKDK